MWTFILCLTSTAMYQAAGKTGKKVQTCLRRLTFITTSGIKPHALIKFFIFFFFFFLILTFGHAGGMLVVSTIELFLE